MLATRPRTLLLSLAPVLVASAASYKQGAFDSTIAIFALITASLLQIGCNLANDVYDFEKGADDQDRLGPVRVVASGLLSSRAVKTACHLCFILAFFSCVLEFWFSCSRASF